MKIFNLLFFVIAGWFAEAWALMIAAGMVRAHWLTMMPPMGYRAALVVSLAVSVFTISSAVVGGLAKAVIER